VATLASLVERVRLELGDLGQSFVTQFMADGTTNRFQLQYNPIDAAQCRVFQGQTEITDDASVEESTGTLVLNFLPADGTEFTVSGIYYRYFTGRELETIVSTALLQHVGRKRDALGREITIESLPVLEEYPVALYATTLALYTLATDASFDINIFAPDGVSIPRSERYRQLMEMIDSRREQYRELCVQLGIGMYTIEVFTLRRISKMSNRYVPVYAPMEVDDRSRPTRVDLELPTYGDKVTPWPSAAEELQAFEGFEFTYSKTFEGDYEGKEFTAKLLSQRASVQVVRNFVLTVLDNEDGTYTATMTLSAEDTKRLPRRTYWSLSYKEVDAEDSTAIELFGANFFTERANEAIV
jgi:hypothetical protein